MTVINFYDGSIQFDSIQTNLNVAPEFIEYKLSNQYEYRPTEETLWATISKKGIEVSRYKLEPGYGLYERNTENGDWDYVATGVLSI